MKTPKLSKDHLLDENSARPTSSHALNNGSLGNVRRDLKPAKRVSQRSRNDDEGSGHVNGSLSNTRRYPTRKNILLANQSPNAAPEINKSNEATKEALTPPSFTSEARRYPSRKSVILAKQLKSQNSSMVDEDATREVALPSRSKLKNSSICKSARKHSSSSTGVEVSSKIDGTSNGQVTISLKRKLRSHERSDFQSSPSVATSGDEMTLWLQGTQFENFCIVEGDMDDEVSARRTIQGIIQIFQTVCARLEARSKSHSPGLRADLMALKFLKQRFKYLDNNRKYLGAIPGIEIGDVYHYRAEMLVIGLHRNLQAGIGCAKHGEKMVAASIVSCGGYNNAIDSSGILIYCGAGGHPGHKITKEKSADQKLEGGNLALKNSIEAKTPVRVIYGLKEDEYGEHHALKSKKIAAYVYDGLYLVEKYWSESVSNGSSTLKFQLRRISGQRETGIKVVPKANLSEVRRGVCIEDISNGKEKTPIIVVNTVDHELPIPFTYVTRMIYPPHPKLAPPKGCDCKGGCSDSVKCACVLKNGGEIPFNKEGAIVEAKPLVYECGPACKCPPSCQNRVSQHGIKFRLEVFKTKLMGWGVRSPTRIPSGSFICEYIGEMLEDADADKRENDGYLFDIGHNYNDETLWEGLQYVPSLQKRRSDSDTNVEYTIDAANFANVGRFINHGCTPNLYAQNILYDHDEQGMPHVMLFACEDIPPFEELTYHYNYYIDRVQGPDGEIKKKECYCGSFECTGRLY